MWHSSLSRHSNSKDRKTAMTFQSSYSYCWTVKRLAGWLAVPASPRPQVSEYDIFQTGLQYRGADKSLARSDLKKPLKGRHFSSDAEVTAAAETWLDAQPSELFLSGLQKLRVWSL